MNNTPTPDQSKQISLEKLNADFRSEVAMNAYHARLLRLLADYVDSRSDAQIASVVSEGHGDAKAAIAWLIEARRDIGSALNLIVLNVALYAKEQELQKKGE